MNTKIKSGKLSFKITDFIGIVGLVYPVFILVFEHRSNFVFFVCLAISIIFLSYNFFGLAGYYIKLDNKKIYFFDRFVPYSIKIINIVEIEKSASKIILKTCDQKVYSIDLKKIIKTERFKTTDLFYDIYNKIQCKSIKDIEQLT